MVHTHKLENQISRSMNPEFFRNSLGVNLSQRQIDLIASGREHPEVLDIKQPDGSTVRGKISMGVNASGEITLKINEYRDRLHIPDTFAGKIITDKARQALEKGMPVPGPAGYALVADRERNCVKAVAYSAMGIPSMVGAKPLPDEDRYKLLAGKELDKKITVRGNKAEVEVDVKISWNRENRSLTILHDNRNVGLSKAQQELLDRKPPFLGSGKLALVTGYAKMLGFRGNELTSKARQILKAEDPDGKTSYEGLKENMAQRMLNDNAAKSKLGFTITEKEPAGTAKNTITGAVGEKKYNSLSRPNISQGAEKAVSTIKEASNALFSQM